MNKKMLVNATQPEENRVAIVADGILTELDIEVVGREQTKGNIYKATVVRVEQGLQAAFIDYGAERLGFLQMGEIHPPLFKAADPHGERKGKLRINDVLRRGQELLVQVEKGARGTKGAALTTHLSLAGRYMVLMPESDSKGISRKIENEAERKKLKKTMDSLDLPENMGFIVRTAGIDQSKEELKRDFDYLVRVYENILALARKAKSPSLIYKESNLVIRSIRDYFTPDIDEVLVDDPKVAQEAKDFLAQVMPECVKLVKLHQEKRPIFSRYQIEEQIETISKNKVLLPSGGSIVIDRTEALVSIDVNSGKMAGEQGIEATALRTNLEAAEEAARQLRLRDLGGLIVIDFIDMRERKHNRDVEKRLKESLKNDKAKVSIGRISDFGLLEMSRQRIKDALAEGTFLVCPHCEGSGRVKSAEAQAAALLRKIQAGIAKGQIGKVEAEVPIDAAIYLLNAKRAELIELEQRNQIEIFVRGRADLIAGQAELSFVRREKEDDLYLPPVTAVPEPVEMRPVAAAPVAAEAAVVEEPKKRGRKKKSAEAEPVAAAAPEAERVEDEAPAATPSEEELRRFGGLLAESDDEGTEATKKKRKRRRKKKKGATAGDATAETSESAESDAGDDDGDEGDDEAAEAPAAETPADGETQKKRKRKRRRKKKGAAVTAGETADAAAPPDDTESSEEDDDIEVDFVMTESADESAAAPEGSGKKKRKRKRKKKGGAAAETAPALATDNLPPLAAELIASLHAAPAEEGTPAKAPRKGRAPKSAVIDPAPEVAPTVAAPEAVVAEKPKRGRKKATPTAEPSTPPVEEQTEEPTPAKRSRSKKVATPAEPTPAPAAEESAPAPRKRKTKAQEGT